MDKISKILFSVLIILISILFYFQFFGNPLENNSSQSSDSDSSKDKPIKLNSVDPSKLPKGKIAYVDLDSISLKYDLINDQSKSLKSKYDALSSQYESMAMSFQEEYKRFQESVNAGIAPQSQLEQKQVELQQKNNAIIQKENQIKNLEMEMEKVRSETTKEVYSFIARYNEKFKYDFILAKNSLFNTLAYANPEYDITKAVIDGLNEEYRTKKNPTKEEKNDTKK
ncbi:MAG: OmpH family outer membrane protein [Bacteroidota bacterium]